MAEKIGLEAVLDLSNWNRGISSYTASITQMNKATSNFTSTASKQFVGLGQGVLKFGAIAGGIAVGGAAALTAGIVAMGFAALDEVSKFERMTLSITNLVAREISGGQLIEQSRQTRIQLSEKELKELEKLQKGMDNEANSRDVLTARIQEQKERIRQLTDRYGENGLVVIKERAELEGMELDLTDLNDTISTHQARIEELNGKQGQLVNTLEKVRVGQMSMADAMKEASPRAQELIKWIQLLAIQSPFTSEGIQSAFQTALAYGFTTEQAQRLTEAEVDFTAATGKSAQAADLIALALGQIQARGKLSAQELRQLSEQGIGTNRILEDMGFSLDDVTNGLVPVDEFIEAVIKDMEIFKGAAKDQATTFSGLVSSLSEVKSIGLREFFTGTFEAIRPYLANFVDFLTKAAFETGSIRELGEVLGQKVGGALATINKWAMLISNLGGGAGLTIFTDLFGTQGVALWGQVSTLISNIAAAFGEWSGVLGGILPSFSELSGGVIPALISGLAFLNQHFEEFKGALLGIGVVLGGAVFAALVAGILALLTPINLIIAAAALLGAAWVGNWGGIQEKTFAVWAVVQPILQQIYDWLAVNIPIAVQMTTDFWNNTLYPSLVVVSNWITGTLIPTLTNVWTWLSTNIPAAIQTVSDFWTNTLLPAITTVSDYLSTNVLPLFQAFNDFTAAVFNKTIQAAAGLWQNILWPALQKVWSIISESLQPIFESLGKMIEERVSPTLNKLGSDILPPLAEGLETVTRWIKDATGFFKDLTDAVNNFTLPPVLTPGSPTPFELALLGIANAADLAGISMANLNNLSMPGMFDKLFEINRGITDFNLLVRKAKDGITSWGKANFIGSEKSANAIRFFTDQFKSNFSAIMGAQNPMQAWMDIINTRNWRKIQLSGGDAREMGQMFFNNFFKEAGKAASQLQDMIISGSQTALQMATTLNQFSSQQAEYLKTQVENLQDFIASGETSLDFNGNIINAVEAQELLNQKLQEQKDIQDDILQIKQQESKLQFLQSQLDLIKMIKDAGLNVKTVLGDISLGLDASIPDMLAATNNVIQAIINQVDQDLGSIITIGGAIGGAIVNGVTDTLQIASDSKVMARLGQYTMSGFINGMKSQAPNLFGGAVSQSLVAGLPSVQGNTVTNNTYYDFNMNVNTGASAQGVIAQYGVMRGLLGS